MDAVSTSQSVDYDEYDYDDEDDDEDYYGDDDEQEQLEPKTWAQAEMMEKVLAPTATAAVVATSTSGGDSTAAAAAPNAQTNANAPLANIAPSFSALSVTNQFSDPLGVIVLSEDGIRYQAKDSPLSGADGDDEDLEKYGRNRNEVMSLLGRNLKFLKKSKKSGGAAGSEFFLKKLILRKRFGGSKSSPNQPNNTSPGLVSKKPKRRSKKTAGGANAGSNAIQLKYHELLRRKKWEILSLWKTSVIEQGRIMKSGIDPSRQDFSASRFLSIVHEVTTKKFLQIGHRQLINSVENQEAELKNLVKENLARFVRCRDIVGDFQRQIPSQAVPILTDLDSLYSEMKGNASQVFQSVFERKRRADSIRQCLALLTRFKFFFNLPEDLRDLIQRGYYKKVVVEYRKAKVFIHHFTKNNPNSATTLSNHPDDSNIFIKVFNQVESIIQSFRTQLYENLEAVPLSQEAAALSLISLLYSLNNSNFLNAAQSSDVSSSEKNQDPAKFFLSKKIEEIVSKFEEEEKEATRKIARNKLESSSQHHRDIFHKNLVKNNSSILRENFSRLWNIAASISNPKNQINNGGISGASGGGGGNSSIAMSHQLMMISMNQMNSILSVSIDLFSSLVSRYFEFCQRAFHSVPLYSAHSEIRLQILMEIGATLNSLEKSFASNPLPISGAASSGVMMLMGEPNQQSSSSSSSSASKILSPLRQNFDDLRMRFLFEMWSRAVKEINLFHQLEDWMQSSFFPASQPMDDASGASTQWDGSELKNLMEKNFTGTGLPSRFARHMSVSLTMTDRALRYGSSFSQGSSGGGQSPIELIRRLYTESIKSFADCLHELAFPSTSRSNGSDGAFPVEEWIDTPLGDVTSLVIPIPTTNVAQPQTTDAIGSISSGIDEFEKSRIRSSSGTSGTGSVGTDKGSHSGSKKSHRHRKHQYQYHQHRAQRLHQLRTSRKSKDKRGFATSAAARLFVTNRFGGVSAEQEALQNREYQLLRILANCNFTRRAILPELNAKFVKIFHGNRSGLDEKISEFRKENDISDMYELFSDLETFVFDWYVRNRTFKIEHYICRGIFLDGYDWANGTLPVEIRSYVLEMLLDLALLHSSLEKLAPAFTHRVFSRLVERIGEIFVFHIRQINTPLESVGAYQLDVEMEFVERALKAYSNTRSRDIFGGIHKLLQVVIGGTQLRRTEVRSKDDIIDQVLRMSWAQLACFTN